MIFFFFYHDLRTLIRLYRGTYIINFSVIANDPITPNNMKWWFYFFFFLISTFFLFYFTKQNHDNTSNFEQSR